LPSNAVRKVEFGEENESITVASYQKTHFFIFWVKR